MPLADLSRRDDVHDVKDPPNKYSACFITPNYHISRLDAKAVRVLYPWQGPWHG
jgi:hypothetical protein